jgi:hypothetical protein
MKSQLTSRILDSRWQAAAERLGYSRAVRSALLAAVAVFAAAFHPGGARAAGQTLVFRSAPITVQGYGVAQNVQLVPSPTVDGYVTAMSADVVDETGASVPITSVMLHHVVFAKIGTPDATCSQFRDYSGRPVTVPAERFYGAGEERATLDLPSGYGYPNRGSDRWGLVYMLMNHKPVTRTVYVQYTVRYTTAEALTPVRPYWLDVRNCKADPIFDVPGTGPLFSTVSQSATFTMPESGRIVAAGGHLHGGGVRLELSDLRDAPIHVGADVGAAARAPGRPRAGAEAHDGGVDCGGDPGRRRRPPTADRGLREQPPAYAGDGNHARLRHARARDALRASAAPSSRPAQPPVGAAAGDDPPLQAAGRPVAAHPQRVGRRLRLLCAAGRVAARVDVPVALRRALASRRHARERPGWVLVAVGRERILLLPLHQAGRVPSVLLAASDADDAGRHGSLSGSGECVCACGR